MTKKWPYSPGDTIKAANDNADKDGLATGENDYPTNSLATFRQESIQSFFAPGTALWTIASGRIGTMSAGYLYAKSTGQRISVSGVAEYTFPASQDTFVFIDETNGTKRYVSVASSDTVPEVLENEVLSAKVVTNADNIVEIWQDGTYGTSGLQFYPTSPWPVQIAPTVRRLISRSSITPSVSNCNGLNVEALATNATINAPSGTARDMQGLIIKVRDNGTSRSITWNGIYRQMGVTLPTSTSPGKWFYVGLRYNKLDNKWDVVAVAREP